MSKTAIVINGFKIRCVMSLNPRGREVTHLHLWYRHGLLWTERESLKMEKGKSGLFPHITERPNKSWNVLLEALDALCKERRAERYYYSLQSYFTIFKENQSVYYSSSL